MPSAHYQRVLEQDQQLPAPLRWLIRAMSAWWTIVPLAVFIVGYVVFALVPIGGRYLWQSRLIDATQQQVLTWWPLTTLAWLLAAVIVCAALRRLPWRWDSLGRLVCVLGLATILVTQSWAFRSQSTGVVAVPIAAIDANNKIDPLSLTYTTRYGDTTRRELIVMAGGTAPVAVPLTGLPRWNDTADDAMPTLRLHEDPNLSALLGFSVKIVPIAYIADGVIVDHADGSQTVTPTPPADRNTTTLPYPDKALLALRLSVEDKDGKQSETTLWLPFEPEGTDSIVPQRFYQVEGLGTVGLAFRPVSRKLPFALAGEADMGKGIIGKLYAADTDTGGRLLQPSVFQYSLTSTNTHTFRAIDLQGNTETYELHWMDLYSHVESHALIKLTTQPTKLFITAGLITFLLGVAIEYLIGMFSSGSKRNPRSAPAQSAKT